MNYYWWKSGYGFLITSEVLKVEIQNLLITNIVHACTFCTIFDMDKYSMSFG